MMACTRVRVFTFSCAKRVNKASSERTAAAAGKDLEGWFARRANKHGITGRGERGMRAGFVKAHCEKQIQERLAPHWSYRKWYDKNNESGSC